MEIIRTLIYLQIQIIVKAYKEIIYQLNIFWFVCI